MLDRVARAETVYPILEEHRKSQEARYWAGYEVCCVCVLPWGLDPRALPVSQPRQPPFQGAFALV